MKGLAVRNIAVVGLTCVIIFLITTALSAYQDTGFSFLESFLLPMVYGGIVYALVSGRVGTRFVLVAITPIVYFLFLWILGYLRDIEEPTFIPVAMLVLVSMMLIGAVAAWAWSVKRSGKNSEGQAA